MADVSTGDVSLESAQDVTGTWAAREQRVLHILPASLAFSEQDSIDCSTTDLSRHGVGLVTSAELPEGLRVSVTLKLGGANTVAMNGTICWSRAGRVGVRLDRLDHRLRIWLAAEAPVLKEPREPIEEPAPMPPFPRLPRYREELPALVSTGGLCWSRATIMDVSARGVGVYAGALPAAGEVVHFEIGFPDGCETLVAGKVAWVAHAAEGLPLMLAGITIHYADEAFYRFVLARQNASPTSTP